MGCFLRNKTAKVESVLNELGENHDADSFAVLFKQRYPDDWQKIHNKWAEEEASTPPGKKHPMQHPDVYMKEMYRNGVSRRKKKG